MRKDVSLCELSPVFGRYSNLRLCASPCVDTIDSKATRKYLDLEEIARGDGFVGEVLVEHDYPITPDFVNSFVDTVDYKQDLAGALLDGARSGRRNLGDVRDMQACGALTPEEARRIIGEMNAYLSSVQNPDSKKVENVESEVKE